MLHRTRKLTGFWQRTRDWEHECPFSTGLSFSTVLSFFYFHYSLVVPQWGWGHYSKAGQKSCDVICMWQQWRTLIGFLISGHSVWLSLDSVVSQQAQNVCTSSLGHSVTLPVAISVARLDCCGGITLMISWLWVFIPAFSLFWTLHSFSSI